MARERVELTLADGTPLPLRRQVLGAGDFNGTPAAHGHRVLVEVLKELPPGTSLRLTAGDERPGPDRSGLDASLSVAPAFSYTDALCQYGSTSCARRGDTLLMDDRRLHLLFNNAVEGNSALLKQKIRVTPPVQNLSFYSYQGDQGGELVLSGNFKPGTSYRISVNGLLDRYGNSLAEPLTLRAVQRPQRASLSMAGGSLWLDRDASRVFEFDARNVERAQLWIWHVDPNDAHDYAARLTVPQDVSRSAPFSVLPVDVRPKLDEIVTTKVDLSRALATGQSYVIQLRHDRTAFDALPPLYPPGSAASTPPTAFVSLAGKDSLLVHVHRAPDSALVHVAEASTGAPVPKAQVRLGLAGTGAWTSTGVDGIARLNADASSVDLDDADALVEVRAGDRRVILPVQEQQKTAEHLFPDLASVPDGSAQAPVLVHTDRDIYRPGETFHFKVTAFAHRAGAGGLAPRAKQPLALLLKGPDGRELLEKTITTNGFGSVALDFPVPAAAKLGSYNLSVKSGSTTLVTHPVRVAAFDPPKFVVDLQAPDRITSAEFTARISGRYLFGAPLAGEAVSWTLSAKPAMVSGGSLARAGLRFNDEELDENPRVLWTQTGSSALDAKGDHEVSVALPGGRPDVPVAVALQAEVTDASNRAAAARHEVVVHPSQRYAGLRLARSWYGAREPIAVDLGAVDTKGAPVVGALVRAELERIRYVEIKERTKAGHVNYRWQEKRERVGSCSSVSGTTPVQCSLSPTSGGYYRVSASVDGRAGGTQRLWIMGDSEGDADASPRAGDRVNLVPDKAFYEPGETAQILIENPWPSATALVTLESDRLVNHRVVPINGRMATVALPLDAELAPFAHATVTLLPQGKSASMRAPLVGALRLPVTLRDARLAVSVASDKSDYRPRDTAPLTVNVTRQGVGQGDVEVALAVVDEGVLRLTGFHAPDPLEHLWSGSPLQFGYSDTRSGFAEWMQRSHVAGDGGGEPNAETLLTRSNFVTTALWKPALVTDRAGKVQVSVKLPDNLTEFRMLAVALDKQGRAGTREASFRVNEPILVQPAMPRFALQGDRFEAAALLHNTTASAFSGSLEVLGKTRRVLVPAQSRLRIGQEMTATTPGSRAIEFTLRDSNGRGVDSVRHTLDVGLAGAAQHPRLVGSFAGKQTIVLSVPDTARSASTDMLELTVGENLHPELGQQLEFLLGYPHGCVEQTTSSTLPLLAARQILPLLGLTGHDEAFYDKRIRSGLDRLDTMRTADGGLAYWPGGHESSVFGTAYAMRAVVAARKLGIQLPPGLDQSMLDYLRKQLFDARVVPEVRSAIALSLAESGRLAATDTDALADLAADLGVFGKSNLALALRQLKGQSDRVTRLTNEVERVLREDGDLGPKNREDMHSFDSNTRALSQASLALFHVKPKSPELPGLVSDLLRLDEGYTTQATAYRLLALAEHVKAQAEGTAPVVTLDGVPLEPTAKFAGGGRSYQLPLGELKGRQRRLVLSGDPTRHVAFSVAADYTLPYATPSAARDASAVSGENGPDLYRVFTTPEGAPVDLARLQAGQLLRVALLVRQPSGVAEDKFRYLSITDALPAGFEAVDTSLETVARVADAGSAHPFHEWLQAGSRPDHLELDTTKVKIYFDAPDRASVAVSYLVRATTPGSYVLPRASAELMYEPHSTSFSDAGRVMIQ
ncbi:MAG TPA: MG2 domain-containing protein [Polyangiaceae bacterium]